LAKEGFICAVRGFRDFLVVSPDAAGLENIRRISFISRPRLPREHIAMFLSAK
jgi:hypothetical protein